MANSRNSLSTELTTLNDFLAREQFWADESLHHVVKLISHKNEFRKRFNFSENDMTMKYVVRGLLRLVQYLQISEEPNPARKVDGGSAEGRRAKGDPCCAQESKAWLLPMIVDLELLLTSRFPVTLFERARGIEMVDTRWHAGFVSSTLPRRPLLSQNNMNNVGTTFIVL